MESKNRDDFNDETKNLLGSNNNQEMTLNQKITGETLNAEVEDIFESNKDEEDLNKVEIILFNASLIGRILLTIYSFYSFIIVLGALLQYLVIIAGILFTLDSKVSCVFYSIFFCVFCFYFSNIIIVGIWDFVCFPYLNDYNFFHNTINIWRDILGIDIKVKNRIVRSIPSVFAIVFCVLFFFFLLIWNGSRPHDIFNLLMTILCLAHLIIYYFSFWILCCKYIITRFDRGFDSFDEHVEDKNIKDLTLLQYIELIRGKPPQLSFLAAHRYLLFLFYMKIVLSFISLSVFLAIGITNYKSLISSVFLPIWFFLFMPIFIVVSFPVYYKTDKGSVNIFEYSFFFFKRSFDKKRIEGATQELALILLRILIIIFLILVAIGFIGIFFLFKDETGKGKIWNPLPQNYDPNTDMEVVVPSPICNAKIHGIKIHQILALINEAYYWNNFDSVQTNLTTDDPNASDFSKWYTSLFFDTNKEKVIPKGDLIYNMLRYKNSNEESYSNSHSKVILFEINTENNETINVLSVKGTTTRGDIFVDAQLFLPAALLTVSKRLIPLFNDQSSYSSRIIEQAMNFPFHSLKEFTLIDKFITELDDATKDLQLSDKTIIIGHSLGGGLSKILAKLRHKNAVSLSGPGISMTSDSYDYPDTSKSFYSSFIDLIPDYDLVPRVEISGGATFRIMCKAGFFGCHSKERSLCTTLIMCRVPGYKEYCLRAGFSEKEIQKLVEYSDN